MLRLVMGWSQGFSEEKTEPSPLKVPLTSFFSSVVLDNQKHDFEKVGMAMKVDIVVLKDELRTIISAPS